MCNIVVVAPSFFVFERDDWMAHPFNGENTEEASGDAVKQQLHQKKARKTEAIVIACWVVGCSVAILVLVSVLTGANGAAFFRP